MQTTLLGLFTEIAILEHLARTRIERLFPDGLKAGEFGLLNYFIVNHPSPDSVAGIAWAFQDAEDIIFRRASKLAELGYVTMTSAINPGDAVVAITEAGREAQRRELEAIGPEFTQLVAEIPLEELEITRRTLHEIRLVMDNLPDR